MFEMGNLYISQKNGSIVLCTGEGYKDGTFAAVMLSNPFRKEEHLHPIGMYRDSWIKEFFIPYDRKVTLPHENLTRIYCGYYTKGVGEEIPWLDYRSHPREFKPLPGKWFTNNPFFLNKYDYDNVIVVSKSGVACPITAHPQYEKWKDEAYPGEFWFMMGESWIDGTEVNPSKLDTSFVRRSSV